MCTIKFLLVAAAFAATQASVLPDDVIELAAKQNFITYTLYNSKTIGEVVSSGDLPANYDPSNSTVVLIHGQGGNAQDRFSREVRQAFRDYAESDWNVFVMDWHFLASGSYSNVIQNIPRAAADLVRFLERLKIEKGADVGNNDVHLIGFGIGAHLAGNVGRQLSQFAAIARITGLDPVGRNFGDNSQRLSIHDATYVEVVHTDSGILGVGIGNPIGHVDFFMNGGNNQPGCSGLSATCSHERAFDFFVASLFRNHLLGNRCNSMAQMNLNNCSGTVMRMGGEALLKVPMLPGIYRVNTGRNFPF